MAHWNVVLATAIVCALCSQSLAVTEEFNNYDLEQLSPLQLLTTFNKLYGYTSPRDNQCKQDLFYLSKSLNLSAPWAVKMVDAMGEIPSGVAIGNTLGLGSFSECTFADIAAVAADNTTYSPQYCVSYLTLNVSSAINNVARPLRFLIGLCFPSSCSEEDIQAIIQDVLTYAKAAPKLNRLLNRLTPTKVVCQKRTLEFTTWGITALAIIGVMTAAVVIGTTYDLFLAYRNDLADYCHSIFSMSSVTFKLHTNSHESLSIINSGGGNPVTTNSYSTYTPQESTTSVSANSPNDGMRNGDSNSVDLRNSTSKINGNVATANSGNKHNIFSRILLCFSAYTNGAKVMNTSTPKSSDGDDQIGCAHGIRFISMTWVILGHTYFVISNVSFNGLNYFTQLKMYVESVAFMSITSGILSVDTFFTMSGLLTCYLTLKALKKLGGPMKLNWALFYVHRYLRLTPVYAAVLFFTMPLFRHLYYGPIWPQGDVLEPVCAYKWWTNMLYVNNIVDDSPACMGHAWYLANDMQFYVISPLVMIPWFYNAFAGFLVSGLLVACSIISSALIVVNRHYSASLLVPGPPPEGMYENMFHDLYTKPYSRVGTYAVGMMAGYLMYRINLDPGRKERFFLMHRGRLMLANIFGWLIIAFFCLSTVYGPYNMQRGVDVWSDAVNALYVSTARLAWSIGICYLIMACAYGYGGWINRFLSWRLFVPLSRLTYAAYLIHFYVIQYLYLSSEQPISLSVIFVIYYYFGHIALSYGLAFCLSMVFEAPIFCLEKIIFGR